MQLRGDQLTAAEHPKYTCIATQLNSKLTAAATSHLSPPWNGRPPVLKFKGTRSTPGKNQAHKLIFSFLVKMFCQDKIKKKSLFLLTIAQRQTQTYQKLRDSHTNINLSS